MTRLSAEVLALVEELSKKWVKYKAEVAGGEARIRRQLAAELDKTIYRAKVEVAWAARLALDAGATKVALRQVTSKNPGTLEEFLKLLEPSEWARAEAEAR